MKKWLKIGAFASTLAILAVLVLGASAFAQGPAVQGTSPAYSQGYGMGFMGGTNWGGPRTRWSLLQPGYSA